MSTKTLQTSESTQTTQPTEPMFLSHLVYEPETGSFFTKTKDLQSTQLKQATTDLKHVAEGNLKHAGNGLKHILPDEDGFLLFPVKVVVGATKVLAEATTVAVEESNESCFNSAHSTKHKTKYIKIKAIKAGYLLYFKQLGKPIPCIEQNQVLYSKNLNKLDLRFCNIGLCSRAVLLRINEAQRNLQGDLKLLLHPKDMFSYVVHWTEDGQKKKKVVHDVVLAKKMHLRLQLKFSKVLAKYLVLD